MRPLTASLLLAGLLVGGCGGGGGNGSAASTTGDKVAVSATLAVSIPPPAISSTTTSTAPATTAAPEPASSAALADGRHPGFLTKVDASGRSLTIDIIQFLTGEAAAKAYREDNPGMTGGPDNDYWVRNVNTRLRTYEVSAGATITVNSLDSGSSGDSTKDRPITLAKLAELSRSQDGGFEGGKVTKIEQQFVP
jgi:hypothetical protein